MYHKGQGVPQNLLEAIKWYRRASDNGHGGALSNLGYMYQEGQGVSRDFRKAVKKYRLAAALGQVVAMYNLGFMYEKGQGMPGDLKRATSWYRKAADQGDAHAQYRLGLLLSRGNGAPKDYVQVYKWLYVSGAHDAEAVDFMRDLESRMSAGQVEESIRQAREWIDRHAGLYVYEVHYTSVGDHPA